MTSVNLAELYDQYRKEDEITVLEPGEYQLEVVRASVRQGNKGEGIMPVFKVVSGPYAGKTCMAGQFTASPDGRSIFFRQLAGFGLGPEYFAQSPPMADVAKQLVGRVIQAKITQRPWQGQQRNNIAIGGIKLVGQQDAVAAPAAPPAAPPPPTPPTPAPAPQPAAVAADPAAVADPGVAVASPPPPPIPGQDAEPF